MIEYLKKALFENLRKLLDLINARYRKNIYLDIDTSAFIHDHLSKFD